MVIFQFCGVWDIFLSLLLYAVVLVALLVFGLDLN